MAIFTPADLAALALPHVARAWFAHVVLPSGERFLHTGMGPKVIDGQEWQGVTDPFGGQLVSVGSVEEPYFGTAPYADLAISGANRAFLKSLWDGRSGVEGVRCDLYFATFDAETGETLVGLKKLFPGKITGLRFQFSGPVIRLIQFKVVSPFEGLNFPDTSYMLSPSGQRRRYPGDKGLDEINADIVEEYKQ